MKRLFVFAVVVCFWDVLGVRAEEYGNSMREVRPDSLGTLAENMDDNGPKTLKEKLNDCSTIKESKAYEECMQDQKYINSVRENGSESLRKFAGKMNNGKPITLEERLKNCSTIKESKAHEECMNSQKLEVAPGNIPRMKTGAYLELLKKQPFGEKEAKGESCEEVTEDYAICAGRKYKRSKDVNESMRNIEKHIENIIEQQQKSRQGVGK